MNCPCTYRRLFWVLAVVGFTLDQATKYGAFSALEVHAQYHVIPDIFSIYHPEHLNKGALFGIGNVHGDVSNTIFAIVSALAVIVILIWGNKRSTAVDRWLSAALGLILAGAAGNLYDRVKYLGVRDFIWVRYHPHFDWPVFNIADVCLVCGAGILVYQAFFGQQAAEGAAESQEAVATASATSNPPQ